MHPHDVFDRHGRASQGLLTAARLRELGVGSTCVSRAVSAGHLVRVRAAVYAAQALPPWPRRVVEDGVPVADHVVHVRAVLLTTGATACGRTAAALRGWGMLVEPSRTVEVAVPQGAGTRAYRHVVVRQRRVLAVQDLRALPGTDAMPVTAPLQTVVDCCLALPLVQAVVLCDSALRGGEVTLEQVQAAARRLPGVAGAERCRRVLALVDPECGSVLESVQRVRFVLAGVTGFTTQRVLTDTQGRHVLRADFCFEPARLVVEVDGSRYHQDRLRDRRADNALAALGWRVLRYDWADVVHDADRVVAEVRAALAALPGC